MATEYEVLRTAIQALRNGNVRRALDVLHCTDLREALLGTVVSHGSLALVLIEELLRAGARADDAIGDADSAVVVNVLVKAGADPNGVNCDGVRALLWASGTGNVDVVRALLANGACANVTNDDGENAIAYAAGTDWGHAAARAPSVIGALVEYGGDVNLADVRGRTPLHKAAESEAVSETLRVLLIHGGDPNARTRRGETAVELLLRSVESPQHSLLDKLSVLVEHGASIDSTASSGQTYQELASSLEWLSPFGVMAVVRVLRGL